MGRSQQLERTRSDIFDAILRLLDRKTIDKISISDIASEAKINRATFYLHFTDKFDALEHLSDIYIAPLREILSTIYNFTKRVPLEQMDHMFETFYKENGPILRKLLGIQSPYFVLRQRISNLFLNYISESSRTFSELEQQMMSGLITNFFVYYMDHEFPNSFVTTLFESCQSVTLMFFRMEKRGDAKQGLEKLIEEHAWGHTNQR